MKDKTKEVINEMLQENTGRHMLDSGGAYGRNFEKNQDRNFDAEPACSVDIWNDSVSINYNVYHYLVNFLEYDEQMQSKFEEFICHQESKDNHDCYGLVAMHEFAELYADSWESVNTYNHESLVSQVLQYVHLTIDDEEYLLLQVHGGCDVRGGYTEPKAFKIPESEEGYAYFRMAESDLTAYCTGDNVQQAEGQQELDLELREGQRNCWQSDDCGYHWYFDGSTANKKPVEDFWQIDEENKIVRCKDCGSTIEFSVTESW